MCGFSIAFAQFRKMPVRKTCKSNLESAQKGFKMVRDTKNKDSKEYPKGENGIFVVSKSYIISTATSVSPSVHTVATWR